PPGSARPRRSNSRRSRRARRQQVVRLRHRADAAVERLTGRGQVARAAQGLPGDRLDRRERVLDAMLELVVEQPLQFLGFFELGQVAARAGDRDRLALRAFAFELDVAPRAEPAPAAVAL